MTTRAALRTVSYTGFIAILGPIAAAQPAGEEGGTCCSWPGCPGGPPPTYCGGWCTEPCQCDAGKDECDRRTADSCVAKGSCEVNDCNEPAANIGCDADSGCTNCGKFCSKGSMLCTNSYPCGGSRPECQCVGDCWKCSGTTCKKSPPPCNSPTRCTGLFGCQGWFCQVGGTCGHGCCPTGSHTCNPIGCTCFRPGCLCVVSLCNCYW